MLDLTRRRWDRIAVGAIVVGALVRALWVFILHQPFDHVYSDMEGYVSRAKRLAMGDGLEIFDAHYPIGTHVLLAVPFRLFGIGETGLWAAAVLWWALSSLVPLCMWRLGRLLLTPAAAALTAALCALWPLFFMYAGFFSSETPSLALLSGGLWLSYRAARAREGGEALTRGLGAGLVFGAAMAVRFQFVLNAAIVAIQLLRRPRRIAAAAALTGASAAVLAAVVAHNSVAESRLAGVDGHGGLVFFVGHCDVRKVSSSAENTYFVFGPPTAAQLERGREYHFVDHQVWDAGFFYGQGLHCIRDDGAAHLSLLTRGLANMTATTVPWPMSNEPKTRDVAGVTNFVYSVVALPVIVVGALLLIRRRRAAGEPAGEAQLLLHLACVLAVAVVSGLGEPRYRAVYDLFGLALLAALVADRWLDPRGRSPAVSASEPREPSVALPA